MPSERVQRQIDRLLDDAEEALTRFDWDSVRQCTEAVLALDRDNQDALTFLEAAEIALKDATGSPSTDPSKTEATLASTPASSPQPTSFADGHYEVKKLLGEGGKKKVYLAHDIRERPSTRRRNDSWRRSSVNDHGRV